jgi:hypothetical protein
VTTDDLPLPTLLSRLLIAFTTEFDNEAEHRLEHRTTLDAGGTGPGGWRARNPYLRQTTAVLDDLGAALPHYPMVLHRGGWPDGS